MLLADSSVTTGSTMANVRETRQTINGKVVLLRKGKAATIKGRASLTEEQTKQIVFDYTYSTDSLPVIAEKYNTTVDTVTGVIRCFQSDMNNHIETRQLMADQELDDAVSSTVFKLPSNNRKSVDSTKINESFLELLSHPLDKILTTEEQTYCWIYTYTNNNNKAIKESGLDKGLDKRHSGRKDGKITTSFANAIKLRGYYLRNKQNIANYITKLREEKLSDLKIDKGYIQSHLITEIEQLCEEGDSSRVNSKLRALDLLGKTLPGCFSETIKVEEVSPDAALDSLLALARADIMELSSGHGKEIEATYTTQDK